MHIGHTLYMHVHRIMLTRKCFWYIFNLMTETTITFSCRQMKCGWLSRRAVTNIRWSTWTTGPTDRSVSAHVSTSRRQIQRTLTYRLTACWLRSLLIVWPGHSRRPEHRYISPKYKHHHHHHCGQLLAIHHPNGWLGTRVVSVLNSRIQIAAATLSGNSLRQTVHTHRASVHQAAKMAAALLRAVRVTAGLEESNGRLLLSLWLVTCRLTA